MILLGICVVALLVGLLRVATQRTPLPTGSSYSTQPNGAQALYSWLEEVGGSPSRLQDLAVHEDQAPATLLVLQPENTLDSKGSSEFDVVVQHGGTVVLAGDSLGWLLYARDLGVTVEPIRAGEVGVTSPDGTLRLLALPRYRVRDDGGTPLLITPSGDWVAMRMPYKQGSLLVLATAEPLLNESLRNESVARFVYREIVLPSATGAVAFDEAHHSFAPPNTTGASATLSSLLFNTSPGRAIVYVAVLAFAFVVLSGRRLGPALPARTATETRRTMFEHVQMLANLYRRAGQLSVVRTTFVHHYARLLARSAGSPRRAEALAQALARIENARTEDELISAVASGGA
jgi:hypothetical protein